MVKGLKYPCIQGQRHNARASGAAGGCVNVTTAQATAEGTASLQRQSGGGPRRRELRGEWEPGQHGQIFEAMAATARLASPRLGAAEARALWPLAGTPPSTARARGPPCPPPPWPPSSRRRPTELRRRRSTQGRPEQRRN